MKISVKPPRRNLQEVYGVKLNKNPDVVQIVPNANTITNPTNTGTTSIIKAVKAAPVDPTVTIDVRPDQTEAAV